MVDFYIDKIKNGRINANTGMPWSVSDVPGLWRRKVEAGLE